MISISIVSLNNFHDLEICIDSLINFVKLADYEIKVNAFNFDDESKNKLLLKYKSCNNIYLLFTYGIRGYSENHNINLATARHKIVCILNDDTYIKNDIFSNIFEILHDDSVAACCPVFLNYDGSIQCLYRRKLSPWFYLSSRFKINKLIPVLDSYARKMDDFDYISNRRCKEIEYGQGACFLIKKECLPDSKLDETFFLGPDDLYWSYLLRRNKKQNKIVLSADDVIYHKSHVSISRYFPAALPAQIKGMVELFEKIGFRCLYVFKIFLFVSLFLFLVYHTFYYLIANSKRQRLLQLGYVNTIRIFWRNNSNRSVFKYFNKYLSDVNG